MYCGYNADTRVHYKNDWERTSIWYRLSGVSGCLVSGSRQLVRKFMGTWVWVTGMGFLFWNGTLLYNSSAWMHCIWGVVRVFGME